eukprot:GHVH01002573.1.p1 GENE.GHVH01002573.1~~GHVH01002573.1.p1  ORF type:complete len:212 (+),score=16.74 GHVH01002573.1:363-998(+)
MDEEIMTGRKRELDMIKKLTILSPKEYSEKYVIELQVFLKRRGDNCNACFDRFVNGDPKIRGYCRQCCRMMQCYRCRCPMSFGSTESAELEALRRVIIDYPSTSRPQWSCPDCFRHCNKCDTVFCEKRVGAKAKKPQACNRCKLIYYPDHLDEFDASQLLWALSTRLLLVILHMRYLLSVGGVPAAVATTTELDDTWGSRGDSSGWSRTVQ